MAIIPSRVRGMGAASHKEYSRRGGFRPAAALSGGDKLRFVDEATAIEVHFEADGEVRPRRFVATAPGMLYRPAMTEPRASAPPTDDQAFRRDRMWGLVIIVMAFGASLGLSVWSHRAVQPPSVDNPSGVTDGVVGWPSAVHAVRSLPAARRLSPWPTLSSITVSGVRSAGTLDVENKGHVRYIFEGPPEDPADKPGAETLCPLQVVTLGVPGLVADRAVTDRRCPKPPPVPLPDPKCGPGDVWEFALDKGYTPDSLANLHYYRSVSRPAWSFRLQLGNSAFSVDAQCEMELSPKQARRYSR